MSHLHFPKLPGLAWSVHKRPTASTRVAKHVSGRTVRVQLQAWPLWSFELAFDVLRADTLHAELQQMMQFFVERGGSFDSFLFEDPGDCTAGQQLLGAGDGVRTQFTFLHPLGAALGEPVGEVEPAGMNVAVAGTGLPAGGYGIVLPSTLVLATAPAAGQQVTADYRYYFRCCFDDDQQDYENFMFQLWQLQSCKFTSVKP